jgi:hypothetical protein
MKNQIFVFGSNLAGRHACRGGMHAALTAYRTHGAIYGQGYGMQGNSFAIPTKDENLNTLPVNKIAKYVDKFINYAVLNPDLMFQVTRIGCGLAGYEDSDIAPLFINAPSNCILPVGWRNFKPHSLEKL